MDKLLQNTVVVIVNPLIQVLFAVALVSFIYGIFEFVRGADQPEVRTKGQQHMLWGIIGLFIMISVFTIIRILLNTIGVTGSEVPSILPR
jgi:uncharacterized membrane protein YidH (DUF202 family)